MLEIDDLRATYQTQRGLVHAVDGVSFQAERGKIIGLIGESGCGKSTLARSIVRVLPVNGRIQGGKIQFQGNDLLRLSEAEMRKVRWRQIALIPQASMDSLNPVRRVGAHFPPWLRRSHVLSSSRRTWRSILPSGSTIPASRPQAYTIPSVDSMPAERASSLSSPAWLVLKARLSYNLTYRINISTRSGVEHGNGLQHWFRDSWLGDMAESGCRDVAWVRHRHPLPLNSRMQAMPGAKSPASSARSGQRSGYPMRRLKA